MISNITAARPQFGMALSEGRKADLQNAQALRKLYEELEQAKKQLATEVRSEETDADKAVGIAQLWFDVEQKIAEIPDSVNGSVKDTIVQQFQNFNGQVTGALRKLTNGLNTEDVLGMMEALDKADTPVADACYESFAGVAYGQLYQAFANIFKPEQPQPQAAPQAIDPEDDLCPPRSVAYPLKSG